MDNQFLGHELEEWYPQEPTKGPPLPRWLGVYWPWYKGVAPPPPGYANLYGVVTDSVTGQAISGVLVALDSMTAYTDANGNYALANIPIGSYTATFSKAGYETAVF